MNYLISGVDENNGEPREIETFADDERHAIDLAKRYGLRDPKVVESSPPVVKTKWVTAESSSKLANSEGGSRPSPKVVFIAVTGLCIALVAFARFFPLSESPHHDGATGIESMAPHPSTSSTVGPDAYYSHPNQSYAPGSEEARLMNHPNMRGFSEAGKRHVIEEGKKLVEAVENLERRRGR